MIKFLVFLIVVIVVIVVIGATLEVMVTRKSSGSKAALKDARASLSIRTAQLHEARVALTKIASNEAGHPALEAQIALNEIHNLEMKEISR